MSMVHLLINKIIKMYSIISNLIFLINNSQTKCHRIKVPQVSSEKIFKTLVLAYLAQIMSTPTLEVACLATTPLPVGVVFLETIIIRMQLILVQLGIRCLVQTLQIQVEVYLVIIQIQILEVVDFLEVLTLTLV